jgi:hypothetical protein
MSVCLLELFVTPPYYCSHSHDAERAGVSVLPLYWHAYVHVSLATFGFATERNLSTSYLLHQCHYANGGFVTEHAVLASHHRRRSVGCLGTEEVFNDAGDGQHMQLCAIYPGGVATEHTMSALHLLHW